MKIEVNKILLKGFLMVKRGDLVDANEFVVKVEMRLKLKREDLANSNYFGVHRQVCGFQFAITLLLETFWLLSVCQITNLNWIGPKASLLWLVGEAGPTQV